MAKSNSAARVTDEREYELTDETVEPTGEPTAVPSGKQPETSPEGEMPQSHEHAWRGTWNRPLKVDENSHSKLTIARMTDHNVRGRAESDE